MPKEESYIQTDAADDPTDVAWIHRIASHRAPELCTRAAILGSVGHHRGDIECNGVRWHDTSRTG